MRHEAHTRSMLAQRNDPRCKDLTQIRSRTVHEKSRVQPPDAWNQTTEHSRADATKSIAAWRVVASPQSFDFPLHSTHIVPSNIAIAADIRPHAWMDVPGSDRLFRTTFSLPRRNRLRALP